MATLDISNNPKTERFSDKTDRDLIAAFQQRSQQRKLGVELTHAVIRTADRALGELIRRYNRLLWKEAHAVADIDPGDAYAYALQGFERAINKFNLALDGTVVSYALVVVRRSIQLLIKREKRQREKAKRVAVIAPLHHEDELIDPYEAEQREQQSAALQAEVEQLKPSPQKVVAMRRMGMKFTEIGAFLAKTAYAVRMVYNRAVSRLKKRLQHPELHPQKKRLQHPELQPQIVAVEIPPTEPTPEAEPSWMGRLWSRFRKTVRFSKSAAISSNPTPIECQDASDLSVELTKCSAQPSTSTRSTPCSLGQNAKPWRLGFLASVRPTGRPTP